MGYKYFDTPDGQDCDKKLIYMLKRGGIYGLFFSTTYVVCVDTPPTVLQILGRFARITAPCLAVAGAGTICVCMVTDYRKTDDVFNHAIGGFVGGVAGGLAKGNFGHGVGAGLVFAFLASAVKRAQMYNFDPVVHVNPRNNFDDHWSKDYDFTVARKLPKDWIAK